MIKIGANFLFFLSSRFMLHPRSTSKKMCILYQWGQIDPSQDPYFGIVFVVFF